MNRKLCPLVATAVCTGCGRCVSACPEHLISLEVSGYRKHASLSAAKRCAGCRDCLKACPVGALALGEGSGEVG